MSDLHFFLDCSLSFPPSNQHYSVILFFLLEKRQFDSLKQQLAVPSIPGIRLVTLLPLVDVRIHRDCVPSYILSSFLASLSSAHQPQMSDLHFFLDCSLSFPPSNQHYSVILFFLLEKRQFDSPTEQLAVLSIPRIRLVTLLPRVDVRIHRDCVPSNTLSSFPASLSSAHQPQTSEFHSFPDCSLSFLACNRHHPIDLLYLP